MYHLLNQSIKTLKAISSYKGLSLGFLASFTTTGTGYANLSEPQTMQ